MGWVANGETMRVSRITKHYSGWIVWDLIIIALVRRRMRRWNRIRYMNPHMLLLLLLLLLNNRLHHSVYCLGIYLRNRSMSLNTNGGESNDWLLCLLHLLLRLHLRHRSNHYYHHLHTLIHGPSDYDALSKYYPIPNRILSAFRNVKSNPSRTI